MHLVQRTNRGFEFVKSSSGIRLSQSSAIGNYPDSFEKPGSSFLWYGDDQLDREDIRKAIDNGLIEDDLIRHAECWLRTGSLQNVIGGGFTIDGQPVPIRTIDDVDGPLIGFLCRDQETGEHFEDTVSFSCAHIRDAEFYRYVSGEITEW